MNRLIPQQEKELLQRTIQDILNWNKNASLEKGLSDLTRVALIEYINQSEISIEHYNKLGFLEETSYDFFIRHKERMIKLIEFEGLFNNPSYYDNIDKLETLLKSITNVDKENEFKSDEFGALISRMGKRISNLKNPSMERGGYEIS